MNCRKIQRQIRRYWLAGRSDPLPEDLACHMSSCPDCLNRYDQLAALRRRIGGLLFPELPENLDVSTRRVCLAEVQRPGVPTKAARKKLPVLSMPMPVRIALLILVVLTVAWMTPVAGGVENVQSQSQQDLFSLVMIMQNSLMLLVSPLILQRAKQSGRLRFGRKRS